MATRIPALIQLSDPRVAAQLVVYEIRLIAIHEMSPPFGEERASTAVEPNKKFHFQLTNNADSYGIVNRYRWGFNERVHRKKQHASSIRTIPSKNIAFIHVFRFKSSNSMQYRSMLY